MNGYIENLYQYISQLNSELQPYKYCSSQQTCHECPFSTTVYRFPEYNKSLCAVLLDLEHVLSKIVKENE